MTYTGQTRLSSKLPDQYSPPDWKPDGIDQVFREVDEFIDELHARGYSPFLIALGLQHRGAMLSLIAKGGEEAVLGCRSILEMLEGHADDEALDLTGSRPPSTS